MFEPFALLTHRISVRTIKFLTKYKVDFIILKVSVCVCAVLKTLTLVTSYLGNVAYILLIFTCNKLTGMNKILETVYNLDIYNQFTFTYKFYTKPEIVAGIIINSNYSEGTFIWLTIQQNQ